MKKTNSLSCSTIERIATILRTHFNIRDDSYFPIYEVISYLENKGMLTVQIMDDNDPIFNEDVPALYNPYDNFIYLKESVLEEYENNEYRSNFTLAHELFHFIQHQVLSFEFEEVDDCAAYCNSEWQANEFAGQLLIPQKYVYLEVDELIRRFHVTEHCALIRKLKDKNRKNKKSPNNGTK